MPQCICKHAGFYAGRQVEVGDRFQVDQADVALMSMAGLIQIEEPSQEGAKDVPNYATREMVAEAPRQKRGYHRKAA